MRNPALNKALDIHAVRRQALDPTLDPEERGQTPLRQQPSRQWPPMHSVAGGAAARRHARRPQGDIETK